MKKPLNEFKINISNILTSSLKNTIHEIVWLTEKVSSDFFDNLNKSYITKIEGDLDGTSGQTKEE